MVRSRSAELSISDDGLLAAYSIADAGSDWVKWHVRDVTTGEDRPDIVAWSKFSSASWLKDGSGFFYEGYDPPEADALKASNYFHKVFFHRLGTPQSEDHRSSTGLTIKRSTSQPR